MSALLHQSLDVAKVLLQWFGVVLEITCCLGIQTCHGLYTQLLEQLGQNDTAHRVYCIESNLEVCISYCLHVNEVQTEHHVDVLLVVRVVLYILSKMIYVRILKVLCLCYAEHLLTLCLVQELSMVIQEFQCVPHAWIVACCEDDTSVSLLACYGYLCCWRACQTDVYDIEAHTHQCSTHHVLHHLTTDSCIASYNNLVALHRTGTTNDSGISTSKLNNV